MRVREWKQVMFNLENGSPAHRRAAAEEAIPMLRQRLLRLREKAESQTQEYAATLSAWMSREAGLVRRPVAIEQDLREARVVNWMAIFLTGTELALSVLVSLVFAVSAPFLLLLALVSIFALKVGLVSLWRNSHQPQQTRLRLRRYVIGPSLLLTMVSLAALMLARSAGIFALILLPFINLAIAFLSFGVLGLAGGLFALGYLLSWSRHAEERFNTLEQEAVEARRVLQQAERVVSEGRAAGAQSLPEARSVAARSSLVLPMAILLLAFGGGACRMPSGVAAPSTASSPAQAERVTVELWLDWSRSAEEQPYREAVEAFLRALPAIVEAHGIGRLTAWHFGENGWNATRAFDLELPAMRQEEEGEAERIFGQIGAARRNEAHEAWRGEIRAALAPVRAETLLPAGASEPRCTDLVGVFRRIAGADARERRLVVVFTDGDDTCSRAWPAIGFEPVRTALLIALLPGEVSAVRNSLSHQEWEDRRALLSERLPGAVIAPHFGDFAVLAEKAMGRGGRRGEEGDAATRR